MGSPAHRTCVRCKQIERAVFYHYMETTEEATVKVLVERTRLSASTVRKHVWDAFGIAHSKAVIDVIEPNYNTVRCQRLIDAWVPDRRAMRDEILRLLNG